MQSMQSGASAPLLHLLTVGFSPTGSGEAWLSATVPFFLESIRGRDSRIRVSLVGDALPSVIQPLAAAANVTSHELSMADVAAQMELATSRSGLRLRFLSPQLCKTYYFANLAKLIVGLMFPLYSREATHVGWCETDLLISSHALGGLLTSMIAADASKGGASITYGNIEFFRRQEYFELVGPRVLAYVATQYFPNNKSRCFHLFDEWGERRWFGRGLANSLTGLLLPLYASAQIKAHGRNYYAIPGQSSLRGLNGCTDVITQCDKAGFKGCTGLEYRSVCGEGMASYDEEPICMFREHAASDAVLLREDGSPVPIAHFQRWKTRWTEPASLNKGLPAALEMLSQPQRCIKAGGGLPFYQPCRTCGQTPQDATSSSLAPAQSRVGSRLSSLSHAQLVEVVQKAATASVDAKRAVTHYIAKLDENLAPSEPAPVASTPLASPVPRLPLPRSPRANPSHTQPPLPLWKLRGERPPSKFIRG